MCIRDSDWNGAEIWRETMVRVHQNMPLHALPMVVPQRPQLEAPTSRGTPGATGETEGGLTDAVRALLNGILSGN